MTDSRMFRAIAFGSLFLLLPVFGACLDQDSVYGDDRPEGTDPPTASNGMIGYAPAFRTHISIGRDPLAGIEGPVGRAMDSFSHEEGYAALRDRLESARRS